MTHPHQPPEPDESSQYWQNPYWQDPAWQQEYSSAPPPDEDIAHGPPAYPQSSGQVGTIGPAGLQEPPPARNGRKGLWTGASVSALILTAFLVLAFVAPGYLLNTDDPAGGGHATGVGSAHALAEDIARTITANPAALKSLTCFEPAPRVAGIVARPDVLRTVQEATERWSRQVSADRALARIVYHSPDKATVMTVILIGAGGDWCWQAIAKREPLGGDPVVPPTTTPSAPIDPPTTPKTPSTPPGTSPSSPSPEKAAARRVITSMLDAIRRGDSSAARSLACPYTPETMYQRINELAKNKADLRIANLSTLGHGQYSGYIAHVAGTSQSRHLGGTISTARLSGPQPCILLMLIT